MLCCALLCSAARPVAGACPEVPRALSKLSTMPVPGVALGVDPGEDIYIYSPQGGTTYSPQGGHHKGIGRAIYYPSRAPINTLLLILIHLLFMNVVLILNI